MHRRAWATLVALALAAPSALAAAEAEVVAVIACDPYADLKKQIRWIGTLVDQPALDGFAESFIMMATQFKGLAGLDVTRPAGLLVTAAGDVPAVHAYVPVKDLDKLLDALQGVTGPVEVAEGVRRIAPPGGMPLEVVERDGWAIVGLPESPPPVADPTAALARIVERFSLGVEAFPSRMPEPMRARLATLLEQAEAAATAGGGADDDPGVSGLRALSGMLDDLDRTESLLLGVALDMADEQVRLETDARLVPGSAAADVITALARGVTTVSLPATADGTPPALAAHVAAAVPEELRQAAIDGLSTITAREGSVAGTDTAVALLRELLAAMIRAGGYDAAMSIDTSTVDAAAAKPFPALTLGMRVEDGAALEARVKELFAAAGELPDVRVRFDTGRAGGATLHTITLENFGFPGVAEKADDTLDVTLALAPRYAFVLAGGDVPARLAAATAASGAPDADVAPLADVSLAMGPLLRFIVLLSDPEDVGDQTEALRAVADFADTQAATLLRLLVRPIDRGLSVRLSADAGVIRTVVATATPPAKPAGPPAPGPKPGSPASAPALAP